MLIQEQFSKQYFKELMHKNEDYAPFLKNKKKAVLEFYKENETFRKYINN